MVTSPPRLGEAEGVRQQLVREPKVEVAMSALQQVHNHTEKVLQWRQIRKRGKSISKLVRDAHSLF